MPRTNAISSGLSRSWAIAATTLIVTAIVFGGATRVDVMAPIVPRLVAIGILGALLWQGKSGVAAWSLWEKLLWAILLLLPIAQLVPLPFSVWTALPGRDYPTALLNALQLQPWLGVSLTPDLTINSLLALLPALAMYALARQASPADFKRWFQVILALALTSAALGLLQMSAGSGSGLRPYVVTNSDAAVGLFSNANHHASFLAGALVLLGYAIIEQMVKRNGEHSVKLYAAGAILAAMVGAAILFTFSRAGVAFMAFVAIVAVLFAWRQFELSRRTMIAIIVAVVVLAAIVWFGFVSQPGIAERMLDKIRDNGRIGLIPTFVRMAVDYLPFGSGLGSFDAVYRAFEDVDGLDYNYLNHAHNDYAQLIIEAGLPALIGLVLFLGWWMLSVLRLWRFGANVPGRLVLQVQAAALISGIFLVHSLADYPLRGAGMSVVFALCCAALAQTRGWGSKQHLINDGHLHK